MATFSTRLTSALVLPCLLALAGFLFDVAAYYPGQMSFDSAYTWWQARGGESTDAQSPTLTQLWRFTERLWSGPGPVFVLHLLLFWGGLMLIAVGLRLRPLAALLLMLLVGFAPIVLLLRAHVWTDVGLLGALLVVTGALTCYMRTLKRRWLLLALVTGFYALAMRHNAPAAVLPLLVFAVWLFLKTGSAPAAWLRTGALFVLVAAVMMAGVQVVNARVDRHVPLWPALAEFDLAGLSIAVNQVLFPSYVVGPGMDVADLTQAFKPWNVNQVLQNTRHGMREPLSPSWTPDELTGLRRAWLAAIASYPGDYLSHRLAVSAALFGTLPRELPSGVTFDDVEAQYGDNPPVAPNASVLHRTVIEGAERFRDTPAFAPWPYLLIGLVAAPFAWRRRGQPAQIALVLLASAALYALPLILLAVSADRRYLLWSCAAALVAAVLTLARGDPSSSGFPPG